MIDEGKYTAKAIAWDFGEVGEDNKKQIAVQFEITEGQYMGHTITYYGFFTEKAKIRTIESLRNCGWKNDDIMTMEGMGDILVQLVIVHETYMDVAHAKVKWVNRLGGGGTIKLEKPLDMAKKRMFAAEMRMLAKTVAPVRGGYPVSNNHVEEGDARESEEKGDSSFP